MDSDYLDCQFSWKPVLELVIDTLSYIFNNNKQLKGIVRCVVKFDYISNKYFHQT